MALKGKKKSRVRGSQAKRRPASAPRPAYGSHEKPRWYQTTQGMVIGFIIAAVLVVFVWWFVADKRSESQARETKQEQLQAYTTAGFLGSEFGPFNIPFPQEAAKAVRPPEGMTPGRFEDRNKFYKRLLAASPEGALMQQGETVVDFRRASRPLDRRGDRMDGAGTAPAPRTSPTGSTSSGLTTVWHCGPLCGPGRGRPSPRIVP